MKAFFISVYVICIALLALREYKNQEYNWDMIPYMSIIVSYDNSDIHLVHDSVYKILKQQAPANDYQLLTDGGVEMRKHSVRDAGFFRDQLPFYTVKPLYTRFAYCLYKAGIPLTKATLLPSVISYFFIGILICYWLKKYLQIFLALPLSLLIMLCRPVLAAAAISTPDCLSALMLLLAFYFLIEKKSLAGICVFLVLSIFARLDNIIPALFVVLLVTLTGKWKEKVSLKSFSVIALIIFAGYFLVSHQAQQYGWSIFYYPTFISHLNTSYDTNLSFSFSNYFSVAHSQIMSGLYFSDLVLFLLLGGILFIGQNSLRLQSLEFDQLLFIVFVLIIFLRFILQPLVADRLYIAYYIGILVLVVRKFSTRLKAI